MEDSKVDKLIIKYLNKRASEEDLQKLNFWVQNKENKKKFNAFVKTYYLSSYSRKRFDVEKAKLVIKSKLDKTSKPNHFVFKIAAALILGFFIGNYLFKDDVKSYFNESPTNVVKSHNIQVGTDKAILTLESGEQVVLKQGKTYKTKNVTSDGSVIIYDDSYEEEKKELAYNYLTVPRGGKFYLVLPDSSRVWLNSESKLKFPIHFNSDKRVVELVYGEAYFDVSSSKKHNGASFEVITKNQNIGVLGTEFNVKAYKEDPIITTTLIEGKVVVLATDTGEFKDLPVNHQMQLDITKSSMAVYSVNVKDEISWKDGFFQFTNKSLKEITKVLSRWYDVDFIIENKDLENINFKGVLRKTQDIETILEIIKNTSNINAYEIKNRIIYIK